MRCSSSSRIWKSIPKTSNGTSSHCACCTKRAPMAGRSARRTRTAPSSPDGRQPTPQPRDLNRRSSPSGRKPSVSSWEDAHRSRRSTWPDRRRSNLPNAPGRISVSDPAPPQSTEAHLPPARKPQVTHAGIYAPCVRCRLTVGVGGPAGLAEQVKSAVPPKPDDRTIVHVLNRIGFGAAPGDIERVRSMGLAVYIDRSCNQNGSTTRLSSAARGA